MTAREPLGRAATKPTHFRERNATVELARPMQGCRAVHEPMSTAHKTMLTTANSHFAVCLTLTKAISRTRTVEEIYAAALDALPTAWAYRARRFCCSILTA